MIIRIAYFGHRYFGFQYQPDRPTVEAELKKYFKDFRYLSRLDSKVSALWQLIKTRENNYNLNQINAYLPDDIIIISYSLQNISFKTDVKGKIYLYYVPKNWVKNYEKFENTLNLFVGVHDFDYFRKRDSRKDIDTICEIYEIKIKESELFYEVYVFGNRFLWQMVRRLVGSAILVSNDKLDVRDVEMALKKEKRIKQYAAPGEFLILYKVVFNKPVTFYEIEYKWKIKKLEKEFFKNLMFVNWFNNIKDAVL